MVKKVRVVRQVVPVYRLRPEAVVADGKKDSLKVDLFRLPTDAVTMFDVITNIFTKVAQPNKVA
jgi:hypothetical protein